MLSLVVLALVGGSVASSMDSAEYRPADPKATPEVRQLLNRFKSLQGKVYISGQTDHPDAMWIKQHTGKLPVVLALDFMHTPSRMGRPSDGASTAIDWVKKSGGVITFQWHWVSPSGTSDKGGGFYTKNTTFDLAKALADPQSAEYKGLIQDIDDVAAEIRKLDKAKVPMIFRPLHEAQGTWFWWGAKGSEACVALYKIIFRRITQHHGLHNLAWAWTAYPASHKKGDPAAWYPGDDMVDFVVSDYCEKKADYDDLVALTKGQKMVALAETMNAPDPAKTLSEIPWAYWVTWARRDWNPRSEGDMKTAMEHPKTLSLEDWAKNGP